MRRRQPPLAPGHCKKGKNEKEIGLPAFGKACAPPCLGERRSSACLRMFAQPVCHVSPPSQAGRHSRQSQTMPYARPIFHSFSWYRRAEGAKFSPPFGKCTKTTTNHEPPYAQPCPFSCKNLSRKCLLLNVQSGGTKCHKMEREKSAYTW